MTDTSHEHDWVPYRLGTEFCDWQIKNLENHEWDFCGRFRRLENGVYRDLTDQEIDEIYQELRREYS